MKQKLIFFYFSLFNVMLFAQTQNINIDLSGNAYVTKHQNGAFISQKGLSGWTDAQSVISVFFYLHQPTTIDLALYAKGNSVIQVNYAAEKFNIKLQSDDFTIMPVGQIKIKQPGYVQIDIKGVSKDGDTFGEIKQLIGNNVNVKSNYVKDFSDYWGRRGPSVHMAYTLPEGDTEWFYNEITVPKEGETMHSYYMAAGFGEGYFGMQYNSPTERRILFSVWSPFDTQDPKMIPDNQRIKKLRQGEGVHIGEFGNEGSGGQSFLVYPWKAGVTYKFLMQVKPDGNGNTLYTAYFYATDEKKWKLIASFLRPLTNTWYKHAHSFLENFSPEQGYLSRKVLYGNQWACSKDGKWSKITEGTFTHDATASAKVRLDFQGGVTKNNLFYLKMGGFFNEMTLMGTKFNCNNSGKQPQIDWNTLEKL